MIKGLLTLIKLGMRKSCKGRVARPVTERKRLGLRCSGSCLSRRAEVTKVEGGGTLKGQGASCQGGGEDGRAGL